MLISRKCDTEWATYPLDLNPSDFYMWWYLKQGWPLADCFQSGPELKGVPCYAH